MVSTIVKAFNAVIRGLGVLIPVLVVLAVVAFIVYRICLILVRRNREQRQARYQAHPQGWGSQAASVGQPVPVRSGPGRRRTDRRTAGTCCPICIHYLTVCRLGGLENAGAQQAGRPNVIVCGGHWWCSPPLVYTPCFACDNSEDNWGVLSGRHRYTSYHTPAPAVRPGPLRP